MTTPETQERFQRLAELKCRTCKGEGAIPAPGHALTCGCAQDCPDCLDQDGNPTGLQLPELSERCQGYSDLGFCAGASCRACNGAGRIPLDGDRLQAAGERTLDRQGEWSVERNPRTDLWGYRLSDGEYAGVGTDRLTALASTLEAGLSGYRLDLDKADKHDRNYWQSKG